MELAIDTDRYFYYAIAGQPTTTGATTPTTTYKSQRRMNHLVPPLPLLSQEKGLREEKRVKEKRAKRGNITRAHSERKTAHQGVGAAVHHSPSYFSCIHTYLYVKERKINRHIDIQVDDYHGKKDEVRQ